MTGQPSPSLSPPATWSSPACRAGGSNPNPQTTATSSPRHRLPRTTGLRR
jgi:hypothetical protein